jgi:two-component system OmpR family sensor kinase
MKSRTAILAIVALILIATASAVLIVRMTARAIDETASVQAGEAPEIARLYIAKYGSLAAAAPTIVQHVSRTGLRVSLVDIKTGTMYGARGPIGGYHRLRGGRFGSANLPPRMADNANAAGGAGPGGPGGPGPGRPADQPGAEGDGPPPGYAGPRHADWMGVAIAALAGETAHRARIPGGFIAIFPEPEPILAVLRTVGAALSFIFVCSGTLLWLYVRGVRRAALRPLHQTTIALQHLAQRDFSPRTILAGGGTAYDQLAHAYNAAVEAVSSAFAERRAAEIEMQRFIADAGHEMRTPLTIVMGYLDIIDGGALADPVVASRITAGMRTEAVRMRRLIDKLIILARMETPSDIDIRTNIDVVALVARVIESLEPLTTQPIEVTGATFAHVFASEDDIAEALSNIIENAIKYAPRSPITITIDRTDEQIAIRIADRGPGMTKDEARNAFERFYRGDGRGEISGSGLGLAIAKRAVERARGTISLATEIGVGTTFTIALPEMPISVTDPRTSRLTHH